MHIAGELVGRYLKERRPFKVMALGTDAAPVLGRYGASAYMHEAVSGWITVGECT